MILHPPFIITSRLLPGLEVGPATLSIEYFVMDGDRVRWRVIIDDPSIPGGSYEDTTLSLPANRESTSPRAIQAAMGSWLTFLLYAVEHARYLRAHPEFADAEDDLFPPEVVEWAAEHEYELETLQLDLEENTCLEDEP
jgi:hypothetical protein